MANQRSTFSKRNREMKLKDRAREKAERREARKNETRETKGPQIAWDDPGGTESSVATDPVPDAAPPPETSDDDQ